MSDIAASQIGTSGSNIKNSLLSILDKYKEFLSVVIFFLGGLFWVVDYFATKEQVRELHCLMNSNIDFIQGRIEADSLSRLLVQNIEELNAVSEKTPPNAEDKIKQNRLRIAGDDIGKKLAASENASAQALKRLRSGECTMG